MTTDDAISILDMLFENKLFNDTKEKVFCQIWEGKTYEEIAEDLNYEVSYVKHVGACLLRSLSQKLELKVTKSNCQSVFRKIRRHLDSAERPGSEKSYSEAISHDFFLNKKLKKSEKIEKLCKNNLFNPYFLSQISIEDDVYEEFLKNVKAQFEHLLSDLINHPPLVEDLEDLCLKISEIRTKTKPR
jgi:hypothetical protein